MENAVERARIYKYGLDRAVDSTYYYAKSNRVKKKSKFKTNDTYL